MTIPKIAVYPGSFDPITLGHVDLIQRGLRLFDKLIVGIGINSQKKPMFETRQRLVLIQSALGPLCSGNRIHVETFNGMLGDFAHDCCASFILRGMRTLSDFDFEFQIAFANQTLYPNIETVFVATDPKFGAVSSSAVRELLRRSRTSRVDGLERFVPEPVAIYIRDLLDSQPHWCHGR